MRKILNAACVLLCIFTALTALASCKGPGEGETTAVTTGDNKPKEGIALDKSNIVLAVGQTQKLTATMLATGKETSNVLWLSDNPEVVSVSPAGAVTGVAEGKTIISASTIDNKYTAKCEVTVTASVVEIKFESDQVRLNIGESKKLNVVTVPEGLTVELKWRSSVENVVRVSEDGTVTGLMSGTSSIFATTADGKCIATCNVTVMNPVSEIKFTESEIKLNKGVSKKLEYTVSPADATEQVLAWSSSDDNVVTVSEGGVVTAVGTGIATITVTAQNGVSANCTVEVTTSVTEIKLDLTELVIEINKTGQLVATVLPEDASVKSIVWASSDTNIATVDENGLVTALKTGTVTIIASAVDGSLSAECEVTVIDPSVSITFEQDEITLKLGSETDDHMTLHPIVTPANPGETFTWKSSNDKIVSVSSGGVIRAKEIGTAVITVKGSSGAIAEITVTVEKAPVIIPVDSVDVISDELDKNGMITVKEGGFVEIEIKISPASATDKTYTFVSSTGAVIVKDGRLYGLRNGTSIITVVANNHGKNVKSKQFVVRVEPLGDTEKANAINQFNTQLDAENKLHNEKETSIRSKYEPSISDYTRRMNAITVTQSDLDAAKAELEIYKNNLKKAEENGDESAAKQCRSQIAECEARIKQYTNDLNEYARLESALKDCRSKLESELATEETRHNDAVSALKQKYDYIQHYL